MKIEFEMDDAIYQKLKEICGPNITIEEAANWMLKQVVLGAATHLDEIIKAGSPDATVEDKARFAELSMASGKRLFKQRYGG